MTLGRRSRRIMITCAGMILAAWVSGCTTYYPGDLLDASDRQKIADTTQGALESARTGESANWENPASGHRGSVTPTRTFEAASGAPCRDFRHTVGIDGRSTVTHDTACRGGDGLWRSVNYRTLSAAATGAPRYYDDPYYYPYPRYYYGYPRYAYQYPYYGSFHFGYRSGYGHRRRYGHRRHRFGLRFGYGFRHYY